MCVDPADARRKEAVLFKLILDTDIVAIQEAHGTSASAAKLEQIHSKTHHMHYSPHSNHMAGGNIIFIKRGLMGKDCEPTFKDIVKGRVDAALIVKGCHSIEVINVHNFDLKSKHRRRVFSAIEIAKKRASLDPSGKSMVFVMGDFNNLPPGETATKLDSTLQTIGAREAPQKDPETYR